MTKPKQTRKPLIFTSKLLDLIECGKKTLTLRKWDKPRIYNPGDIITATNYTRKMKIQIIQCYSKEFKDLTLREIRDDGFKNRVALLEQLTKFYVSFDLTLKITIIKFKYVQE